MSRPPLPLANNPPEPKVPCRHEPPPTETVDLHLPTFLDQTERELPYFLSRPSFLSLALSPELSPEHHHDHQLLVHRRQPRRPHCASRAHQSTHRPPLSLPDALARARPVRYRDSIFHCRRRGHAAPPACRRR
uniref:Uncharacterized protein n=1 Tax=Arundo donax TaxID=35708 RepID=A0A0A8YJG8_ARUDO